jgi:tRNA modification GTPase
MKELMKVIYDGVSPSAGCIEPSLLTNRRQFECVHRASGAIKRGLISLQSMELELVAEELRYAARSLEELTGSISSEDLLDEVFGRFCLGK